MDGTWPGSVKFSPSPHFSVYFQHYTHTQPFATKHFLYDVRTVEQNISLCFPHLDFPFFSRFAWMETPGLSRRKAEVKRHWHSISIIGIYIFFFFLPFSRALGRYVRGSLLFSSHTPFTRCFFSRSEEIVYSRERQEGF